jgi:hypothetical protein
MLTIFSLNAQNLCLQKLKLQSRMQMLAHIDHTMKRYFASEKMAGFPKQAVIAAFFLFAVKEFLPGSNAEEQRTRVSDPSELMSSGVEKHAFVGAKHRELAVQSSLIPKYLFRHEDNDNEKSGRSEKKKSKKHCRHRSKGKCKKHKMRKMMMWGMRMGSKKNKWKGKRRKGKMYRLASWT